jgi:hexosaminidase
MWSEYLGNEKKLEYMLFPRIAALSEVLWSPKEKRNWKDFEKRLPSIMHKLESQQINFSKAYYDLQGIVLPTIDHTALRWKLTSNDPLKNIIYVNSPSQNTSYNYAGPILIKNSCTKSAALADKNHQIVSNWLTQEFHFNKATAKKVSLANAPSKNYPGDGAFTLVNGIQNVKGMLKSTEFLGFSGTDLDATIDLGKETEVSKIILHVFDQPASWIYLPRSVEITYSSFEKMDEAIKMNLPVIRKNIDPMKETGARTITIESSQHCRHLHIVAKNLGIIPNGNAGSGNPSWLFIDEIEVR